MSTRGVPEDEVEVTVKDAGEGLSEDELEQVFNAFFSTKQEKVAVMMIPLELSWRRCTLNWRHR